MKLRAKMAWHDISGCPIDEKVMLFIPNYCDEKVIGYMDADRICHLDDGWEFAAFPDDDYDHVPTHWMPLPAPPEAPNA